jgi:hypothetical protein
MKKPKLVMAAFIIVPFLIISVTGLIAAAAFSKGYTAEYNENAVKLHAEQIAAKVAEYTAFLNAAAEIDSIIGTAKQEPAARLEANLFIQEHIMNNSDIYDIIVCDRSSMVFTSYTGNYAPASSFRDDADTLHRIAVSPTPVSGFYESGRFYCIAPVRDNQSDSNEIVGYIILKSETDFIDKLYSKSTLADSGIAFTVTDDLNAEADGEIAGTRWKWAYSYTSAEATRMTFDVWLAAFAVGAGICAVNIIIMLVFAKRRDL